MLQSRSVEATIIDKATNRMTKQNTQNQGILDPFEEVSKIQPLHWKLDDFSQEMRWAVELGRTFYKRAQSSPIVNPSDIEFLKLAHEVALRDWLIQARHTKDPKKTNNSETKQAPQKPAEEEPRTFLGKIWTSAKRYFSEEAKKHREFEKVMDSLDKTLILQHPKALNKNQLIELVGLVCQTKSIQEKDELFVLLALREKFKLNKQQIKTSKLMRGLATFGALATLALGSANSENRDQMAATMVATATMATLAAGVHNQTKKRQAQHNEEVEILRDDHPVQYQRFQRLRTALGDKGSI